MVNNATDPSVLIKVLLQGFSNPDLSLLTLSYPLVVTNIAMGNGPFIDGLPIKNGDFPWLC